MNGYQKPGSHKIAIVALTALAATACQTGDKEPSAQHAQTTIVAGAAPTDVYTELARKVRNCWLNPADPVLTNHIFHAVANPGGTGTNIVIHERAPDGRRGLKAYTIKFEARGRDTKVLTENQRLHYALSQKMAADVGRWVQGSTLCEIAETRGPAPIPSSTTRVQRGSR